MTPRSAMFHVTLKFLPGSALAGLVITQVWSFAPKLGVVRKPIGGAAYEVIEVRS